jgi:hypothetical protein
VRPEEEAVARETIELVIVAAIQHLTSQQRAVFVFREVLGWSAADTAAAVGLSVASVNSALQRAKSGLRRHLPEDRSQWRAEGPTPQERKVLEAYRAASQSADWAAVANLLTSDVVLTMPPNPFWFTSREAMIGFVRESLDPAFAGVFRGVEAFAHDCQPDARRRRIRTPAGHHDLPCPDPRRSARAGRQDRRDHHVRAAPARGVWAAAGAPMSFLTGDPMSRPRAVRPMGTFDAQWARQRSSRRQT